MQIVNYIFLVVFNNYIMTAKTQNKDLFGTPLPENKVPLTSSLKRYDKNTFDHRLTRLQYLNSVFPKGMIYMLPTETHYLFQEIRSAYVAGLSVSVVMLAQAFIEHYYQLCLQLTPHSKIGEKGLFAILEFLRENDLEHEIILGKVEFLRKIRNPFIHLKKIDHPNTISQRALTTQNDPICLLENDAKHSLNIVLAVLQHSKFKT